MTLLQILKMKHESAPRGTKWYYIVQDTIHTQADYYDNFSAMLRNQMNFEWICRINGVTTIIKYINIFKWMMAC